MPKMTKSQFEAMFREDVIPHLVTKERSGFPDKPRRREAWNNTIDAYIRDRSLPEAAGNWTHPRWLETWQPKRRNGDDHARIKHSGSRTHIASSSKVTNPSGLTLAQWIRAASFARGHGLGPSAFTEARRDWQADVDPAEWGRPRHATINGKKSSAQLDREIAAVLGKTQRRPHSTIATATAAKTKRVPKTRLIWVVQGNYGYGHGWEDVTAEELGNEARARIREYRENERGVPFRLIRRRERINP